MSLFFYLLVESFFSCSLGNEDECANSLRIIQRTSKSPSRPPQKKKNTRVVETFDDVPDDSDDEEEEEEDQDEDGEKDSEEEKEEVEEDQHEESDSDANTNK